MTDHRNSLAARRTPALHDNGLGAAPLLTQSLARLTPEQASALSMEIGKTRLELERSAHQAELNDANGRKAAQLHIAAFDAMDKSGRLTRHELESTIQTGAGKMRIQSRSGSPCFVATATYGDENHADVIYLRGFRDQRLQKTAYGRLFISWYYRNGPKMASVVMHSGVLRRLSRILLQMLVRMLTLYSKIRPLEDRQHRSDIT